MWLSLSNFCCTAAKQSGKHVLWHPRSASEINRSKREFLEMNFPETSEQLAIPLHFFLSSQASWHALHVILQRMQKSSTFFDDIGLIHWLRSVCTVQDSPASHIACCPLPVEWCMAKTAINWSRSWSACANTDRKWLGVFVEWHLWVTCFFLVPFLRMTTKIVVLENVMGFYCLVDALIEVLHANCSGYLGWWC